MSATRRFCPEKRQRPPRRLLVQSFLPISGPVPFFFSLPTLPDGRSAPTVLTVRLPLVCGLFFTLLRLALRKGVFFSLPLFNPLTRPWGAKHVPDCGCPLFFLKIMIFPEIAPCFSFFSPPVSLFFFLRVLPLTGGPVLFDLRPDLDVLAPLRLSPKPARFSVEQLPFFSPLLLTPWQISVILLSTRAIPTIPFSPFSWYLSSAPLIVSKTLLRCVPGRSHTSFLRSSFFVSHSLSL